MPTKAELTEENAALKARVTELEAWTDDMTEELTEGSGGDAELKVVELLEESVTLKARVEELDEQVAKLTGENAELQDRAGALAKENAELLSRTRHASSKMHIPLREAEEGALHGSIDSLPSQV